MAVYPTIFTLYLSRVFPWISRGHISWLAGATMIALCVAWNIRGSTSVGRAAVAMTFALIAPFVALSILAISRPVHEVLPMPWPSSGGVLSGMTIAMWNYMGWDNASTIAGEVERPNRNYPLAMFATLLLVTITYVAPVIALSRAGIDPSGFTTGAWVDVAGTLGGPVLASAIVLGGVICGIGMFNALVMSYSRLPLVLARDGFLPRAFAREHPRTGAPWVAILVCGVAYTACLGLGFERLIELDVVLYGCSLVLEFLALVVLRIREPALPRPYRVPGGLFGAITLGLGPLVLLGMALFHGSEERAGSMSALIIASVVIGLGPVVYAIARKRRRNQQPTVS